MTDLDVNLNNGVFLAIRGGGVKSTVSMGVLKALEEEGIKVVGVSGASLGSIAAALIANGYDANETLQLFLEYNKVLTKASPLLLGRGSIVIEESVDKEIGYKTFQDLNMNCLINASYNSEKDPKMFLFSNEETPEMSVGRACRASSSLQFIYGYYKTTIEGTKYRFFDGGYTANPIIPETDVPVIYCSFTKPKPLNPDVIWQNTVLVARDTADIVVEPYLGKMGTVGTQDDMKLAYKLGYQDAKQTLRRIKR